MTEWKHTEMERNRMKNEVMLMMAGAVVGAVVRVLIDQVMVVLGQLQQ